MRILVVEDEKKLASFLRKALAEDGYIVDVRHNGDDALDWASTQSYAAIVLDIMLPGRDGLSILKELRRSENNVPVLLLSARGSVHDRVEGLNLGADDYLPKPFSVTEVVARVRSLLRRGSGLRATVLHAGDLSLNLVTHEVHRGQTKILLTAREYTLLHYFMCNQGRVITRTTLCEHVWEHHPDSGANTVDVYVGRLRRKIDDGCAEKLFETIRGAGYMLRRPDRAQPLAECECDA